MSQVAEQAAEVTAEVVEDTIDGVVDVVEVVRNNPVTLALVAVAALAAGGAGGYFIAKKQLAKHFEQLAVEEIADAKAFYAGVYKTDEDGAVLTPQEVLTQRHGAEAAAEAVRGYQGRSEAPAETEEDLIPQGEPYDEVVDEAQIRKLEERARRPETEVVEEMRNVFVDPNFDLTEEIKHRSADKPYIITHDEYFENPRDFEQASLTYFETDDTLTNEKDEPQREIDKLIGEDHLVRFGHGSKDRNIVYVRNERLEMDFEIMKSTGSYLEEVLGIENDESNSLKHSDQRDQRRAFRRGEG